MVAVFELLFGYTSHKHTPGMRTRLCICTRISRLRVATIETRQFRHSNHGSHMLIGVRWIWKKQFNASACSCMRIHMALWRLCTHGIPRRSIYTDAHHPVDSIHQCCTHFPTNCIQILTNGHHKTTGETLMTTITIAVRPLWLLERHPKSMISPPLFAADQAAHDILIIRLQVGSCRMLWLWRAIVLAFTLMNCLLLTEQSNWDRCDKTEQATEREREGGKLQK